MSKNNRRIFAGIVICICLVAVLYFCPKGQIELESGYRLIMGTFVRVTAIAQNSSAAARCIESAFSEIEKVDELLSDYRSDSEISELNRDGFKHAVKVSQSTYEVLQRSIEFSRLSAGAFDVTVGPLVDLWHQAGEANSLPSDDQMREARSKVGYEKLILNSKDNTVQFAVEGMRVDLGAIGKGYGVDKAIEAMQNCGAAGGMVDIGGNIRCFGVPPQGKDSWLIGLQDPGKAVQGPGGGEVLLTLKLTNESVSTSGNYQRFVLIKGKRHSHIIDPNKADSAESLSSVTIIADNATDADALSTAVTVMGAEKGLALIETIPQTEAILISSPPNYEIVKTSSADKYIK